MLAYKYLNVLTVNFINGREFLSLTEKEVKEMIPPIGLAKRIIRCLPSSSQVYMAVITYISCYMFLVTSCIRRDTDKWWW